MRTLHIAPSDTAGGALLQAIRDAGRDDGVLSWLDDLSCGPIASGDPSERAEWWAPFYGDRDIEADLKAFWERISTTDDRLVVWFGRHSASELAFFLAWADRIRDRPYEYLDVAALQFPRRDGSGTLGPPVQSVGMMNPDMLKSLLGSERASTPKQKKESLRSWRQLKAENAPFRIVTAAGLVSAAIDCFDPLLLERVTPEWRTVARIIGETMGYNYEPYMQVGDLMLLTRVVALVSEGKLFADGDPRDMRSCRVRLPP
jgi:hypothetical protein